MFLFTSNKWKSILNLEENSIYFNNFFLLSSFLCIFTTCFRPITMEYIKLNAFFVLPMSFFMLHYQSLRGLKKIAEFSFFYRMSQSLFTIVSILIIYQFVQDDEVPIYAYLVSLFIVSLLSFFSFRYHLNKKSFGAEKAELEILNYSQIFKISIPLMFAQSVQFIMAWTDKLMLGSMKTTEDVGIYHTAFKLSMFAAVALMSVNSMLP